MRLLRGLLKLPVNDPRHLSFRTETVSKVVTNNPRLAAHSLMGM